MFRSPYARKVVKELAKVSEAGKSAKLFLDSASAGYLEQADGALSELEAKLPEYKSLLDEAASKRNVAAIAAQIPAFKQYFEIRDEWQCSGVKSVSKRLFRINQLETLVAGALNAIAKQYNRSAKIRQAAMKKSRDIMEIKSTRRALDDVARNYTALADLGAEVGMNPWAPNVENYLAKQPLVKRASATLDNLIEFYVKNQNPSELKPVAKENLGWWIFNGKLQKLCKKAGYEEGLLISKGLKKEISQYLGNPERFKRLKREIETNNTKLHGYNAIAEKLFDSDGAPIQKEIDELLRYTGEANRDCYGQLRGVYLDEACEQNKLVRAELLSAIKTKQQQARQKLNDSYSASTSKIFQPDSYEKIPAAISELDSVDKRISELQPIVRQLGDNELALKITRERSQINADVKCYRATLDCGNKLEQDEIKLADIAEQSDKLFKDYACFAQDTDRAEQLKQTAKIGINFGINLDLPISLGGIFPFLKFFKISSSESLPDKTDYSLLEPTAEKRDMQAKKAAENYQNALNRGMLLLNETCNNLAAECATKGYQNEQG